MKRSSSAFTIVELLIVIVIIAILAAITVVAFNGLQNRAKTTAGQATADQIVKKAKAYQSINGELPTYANLVANTYNGQPAGQESKIEDVSTILNVDELEEPRLTAATAYNGKRVLYSEITYSGGWCEHPDGTYKFIVYWDYMSSQQVAVPITEGAPKGNMGTGSVPHGSSACTVT